MANTNQPAVINSTVTNVNARQELFVNRQDALDRLKKYLVDDEFRFVTVCGEGGVGKTALAHKLISDLIERNIFHSIIWTTAKKKELKLKKSLFDNILRQQPRITQERKQPEWGEEIVESLNDLYWAIIRCSKHPAFVNVTRHSLPPSEQDVLTWLKVRKILLIIDDLDGWMDNWSDVLNFVEKIKPPSAVLITSRYQLDANSVPGLAPVNIGPLSQTHADELIRTLEATKHISLTVNERKEIIHFADGNPLLINLVIGLIFSRVGGPRNFQDILKKVSKQVTVQFLFERLYAGLTSDAQKIALAIAVAQDSNYTRLTNEEIMIITGIRPNLLSGLLDELRMASFIDRDTKDGNPFDMHKLAIDFVISQNPDKHKQYKDKLTRILGHEPGYLPQTA